MTAPTPERRVGEAVAKLSREMVAQVARMNRENYVGELAADWLALTAEVERLTKEKAALRELAVDAIDSYYDTRVAPLCSNVLAGYQKRLAALSLPTPAPEAPKRFVSGEQVMEHYVEGYQRPPAPEGTDE